MKGDEKGFIVKTLLQVIVFFYLYNILFRGFPLGFGTRQIFGFVGLIIFLIDQFKKYFLTEDILIKKNIGILLFLISLIGMIALITNLVNNTDEKVFLRYPISFISVIFSCYFVLTFFKYSYNNVSYLLISKYFINAVLIQVLIAGSMFFIPSIANFFNSIQNIDDFNTERLKMLGELRIVGFGSLFFGSGVVNGFALMLIPTVLKSTNRKKENIFFYALVFLIIFLIGMMMARTTIIGAVLGFCLLFLPINLKEITFSKVVSDFFKNIFIIPFLLAGVILILSKELKEKLILLSNFGFEMFINYIDGNGLNSSSQEELKDMYIWPTTFKPYLIGDGYFIDPNNPDLYYMGSDVGYIRMIYYFGVLGLFIYLLTTIYPLLIAYKQSENKIYKDLFIFSIFYFLILNFKGFTDVFFIFMLFGLVAILNKKVVIN